MRCFYKWGDAARFCAARDWGQRYLGLDLHNQWIDVERPSERLATSGGALTKGIGSAGNNDVFFLYDVIGGEAIGCSFFSGTWSALKT